MGTLASAPPHISIVSHAPRNKLFFNPFSGLGVSRQGIYSLAAQAFKPQSCATLSPYSFVKRLYSLAAQALKPQSILAATLLAGGASVQFPCLRIRLSNGITHSPRACERAVHETAL
jgi:hypothetical protein